MPKKSDKLRIKDVRAFEFLDSRGNPTVAVEVETEGGGRGLAIVPAGASKGKREAVELRDGDRRYWGKGVRKAIENVLSIIKPKIIGIPADKQEEIDNIMIELDGTENKSNLGANAILGVSLACAKASADTLGVELFEYLTKLFQKNGNKILPTPLCNVINGGEHAGWNTDFQEYMIVPAGFPTFSEAIRCASEIFQKIKEIAKEKSWSLGVGDEGGFALPLKNNKEALDILALATEKAGYLPGENLFFALDVAASSFFDEEREKYILRREGKELTSDEMIEYICDIVEKYPVVSVEDGLSENDWDGWRKLTEKLGKKIQLVGDDLFTTNPKIFSEGIKRGMANSILVKVNQIGTLTETQKVINMAKSSGYSTVISHRSGDTEDTFIADLAVASGAGQIKTGSLSRSERVAKYNRLIYIEEKYKLKFSGKTPFEKFLR